MGPTEKRRSDTGGSDCRLQPPRVVALRKGHSYPAVIAHRVRSGSGCPYCSNHKVLPGFNDLATIDPVVASQWHPTGNGSLTPQQVTPGSRRKVWWLCDKGSCMAGGRQQPHGKTALRLSDLRRQTIGPMHSDSK